MVSKWAFYSIFDIYYITKERQFNASPLLVDNACYMFTATFEAPLLLSAYFKLAPVKSV